MSLEDEEFLELGELRINPRGQDDGNGSPSSGNSGPPSGRSTPTAGAAGSAGTTSPGAVHKATSPKKRVKLADAPKKRRRKRNRKWMKGWGNLSLRDTRIVWFLASEAILAIIVSVSLVVQNGQLIELYSQDAKSQLRFLDSTYVTKPNLMMTGFLRLGLNSYVQQFLASPTSVQNDTTTDLYANVKRALDYELYSRKIEFAILLDAEGKIVLSATDDRQEERRFGEFFNPANLTSRALSKVGRYVNYQVQKSVVLPLEDVLEENPPIFRERPFEYLPTGPFHWSDVDTDVLTRFLLSNVHNPIDGSFLGILVGGDVLNGKIPPTFEVVDSQGSQAGFAGAFLLDRQGDWRPASLYRRVFMDLLTGDDTSVDDAAYHFLTDAFLDDVYDTVSTEEQSDAAEMKDNQFLLAGRRVAPTLEFLNGALVYDYGEQADAVVVRGVDLTAFDIFDDLFFLAMLSIGVVVATDLVTLIISLQFLIEPLETLMTALRRKIPVTLEDVEKVNVGPSWVLGMILMNLPGVIVVALIIVWSSQALDDALRNSAESFVGAYTLTYALKLQQMGLNIGGDANQPTIALALADPTNPSYVAAVNQLLLSELNQNQMEFATLVDANANVVASPNADRRGEWFDPHGIINATLTSLDAQIWTQRITYQEFVDEDPPIWHQRREAPISMLSMNDSMTSGIVRYTTVIVDSNNDGIPEGAIVAGDIINGKTLIQERNLRATSGAGYEAMYMKDVDGTWILCSSVLRYDEDDDPQVDIEFPYTSLLQDALDEDNREKRTAVSRLGTINGRGYIFAATPVRYTFRVSSDSGELFPVDAEVFVVSVHGIPATDGDEIKRDSLLFGIGNLFIQIVTSVIGIYLAFDPVRKSIIVLKKYGIIKKDAYDTVLGMVFGPLIARLAGIVETVRREGVVEPVAQRLRRVRRHVKKKTQAVVNSVNGKPSTPRG